MIMAAQCMRLLSHKFNEERAEKAETRTSFNICIDLV